MQLPFTTLDVFTESPYVGNPLAVVQVPAALRNDLTEKRKQKIAREFNYSETTFLHEPPRGETVAEFDIFTPKSRITFAGHPTIGTAIHVLRRQEAYSGLSALRTLAGTIPFQFDTVSGHVTVAVPHNIHTHRKRLPHPFAEAGNTTSDITTVPIVSIVKGMAFGLACLPDLEALRAMKGPLLPSGDRFKGEYLDAEDDWNTGYTGSFYYVDLGTKSDQTTEYRLLRTRSIPEHGT